MRLTIRLSMPYDLIVTGSLIGTEVRGLPGSQVLEIQRVPVEGKPDAADMVVETAEDLGLTDDGGAA